jgi:hypothetical protein
MTRKSSAPSTDAIVFYSYPKLLFIWPLVIYGLLFYFLPGKWIDEGGSSEVIGWTYVFITVIVILTIGVDIERNVAIFWVILFALIYFLSRWLADVKGFTLFGNIYRWFADMDLHYNREFGVAMSIILIIPYSVMLLYARAQDKWRITHNEFEHYSFGRSDDSLARGAKRVRTSYPDLFELLLCGAGTLVVYSATGRSELRRIPHVPMLPWKRRKINEILERTAVTTTHDDDIVEEELSDEMEESAGPEDVTSEQEGGEIGNERL